LLYSGTNAAECHWDHREGAATRLIRKPESLPECHEAYTGTFDGICNLPDNSLDAIRIFSAVGNVWAEGQVRVICMQLTGTDFFPIRPFTSPPSDHHTSTELKKIVQTQFDDFVKTFVMVS